MLAQEYWDVIIEREHQETRRYIADGGTVKNERGQGPLSAQKVHTHTHKKSLQEQTTEPPFKRLCTRRDLV